MASRRSGRCHKIVNYAKLGEADEDDDFQSSNSPDTKRARVESVASEKKVKQDAINSNQAKISKSDEKSLKSSQSPKRLSVEERVFERHVKQALLISKTNDNNTTKVKNISANDVDKSDDDDNDSDDESDVTEDDTSSEEDDDDFDAKSNDKSGSRKKVKSGIKSQKQTVKSSDQVYSNKKEAVPVVKVARLKMLESNSYSAEKHDSSAKPIPSSLINMQGSQPAVADVNIKLSNSKVNTEDITQEKTCTTVLDVNQKMPTLKENSVVTRCHTLSSPIRLPTKGIRIGLSRKVIKPLHVGVRKVL